MKQKTTDGDPSLGHRVPLYCLLLLLSMGALRLSAQTKVQTNKSAAQGVQNSDRHKADPVNLVNAYSLDDLRKQIDIALENATYENAGPIKYKSYSMAGNAPNIPGGADTFNERTSIPSIGGSPEIQDGLMTFTQGGR